ncbi:hypothetical protein BO85DRAFT_448846 [Aspergillus piperis CBS 112811]|uniref:Uncharacterized protein n=1 Tax=Aspergillus piperis CBS 112811 TaxID=1448313 RepID=A0A8G1R1M4_9EURO|nr:hypothetical protein BO85DRAFT_448846 [Aspergillus piperis CBS 112811]RAH57744.1 hypothetical protein BO85DRAFT_448846 [Aspergillus piperis CBS 112811]
MTLPAQQVLLLVRVDDDGIRFAASLWGAHTVFVRPLRLVRSMCLTRCNQVHSGLC